jgi:hypothetical protein
MNIVDKEVKRLKKGLQVSVRIPGDIFNNLISMGAIGTICAGIVKCFYKAWLFKNSISGTKSVIGVDGSVVYPTYIENEKLHITIKNGDVVAVAEINKEAMAHLIINMAEVLNAGN